MRNGDTVQYTVKPDPIPSKVPMIYITTEDASITEIALSSGFNDTPHFYKAFCKSVGNNPKKRKGRKKKKKKRSK